MSWRDDNLTSTTLEDFISDTPLALIAIDDDRFTIPMAESLLTSYRAEHPFDFGFGRMAMTTAQRRDLVTRHVLGVTHADGYDMTRATVGLYLFFEGFAIAHHTGFNAGTLSTQIRMGVPSDDPVFEHIHASAVQRAFADVIATFRDARRGRVPDAAARPARRRPHPPPAQKVDVDPFVTLRVRADAPSEVVRKAYRARVLENHPDRVHGMDRAFEELAHRKIKTINAAWEAIRKARGI